MAGPKAPKDPERKRPYFYIMKDKIYTAQYRKMEALYILYMKATED